MKAIVQLRLTSVAIIAALGAACGLAGCGDSPGAGGPQGGQAAQIAAAPEYAGSASCASCHPKAYQAWLGSHHQRAMLPATADSVAGDFAGASIAPAGAQAGVRASFQEREGRFLVATDGPDGALAEFEARYVFGAQPLQQYLLELPGGRLQALDIAWDTVGQRWFHLHPEENIAAGDPLHWTGLGYNWNFMCADCHSTAVRKGYDPQRRIYETEFAEVSVGCEACHGPASNHIAWAQGVAASAPGPSSGAAPAPGQRPAGGTTAAAGKTGASDGLGLLRLNAQAEQLNSCAPCHSRRTQLDEGFRPDRPLLDHYLPALLEAGLYEADGQILDEVYVYGSFLQSRMHAQGVACGDCHEPHSARLIAQGNALCVQCHNPAGRLDFPSLKAGDYDAEAHHLHLPGSPGAQCVSCHMPARTYMQLDDRRDHGFRVPRPDLSLAIGTPNACNGCHRDQTPQWARDRLAERFGRPSEAHFALVLAAARRSMPEAEAGLAALGENPEQPPIVRATALALMSAYQGAATALALEAGLRDASPLVRIGALRGAARFSVPLLWRRAAHLLDDELLAVRSEAAQVLAAAWSALPAEDQPRLRRALQEYLAIQRFSADRPEAHTNMASVFLALGQLQEAEAALRTALELAPHWVPALVNLADLHRQTGRDAAGGEWLAQAAALAPDAPDVLLARALWLVRQGRAAEALPLLAEASRLAPEHPRYAYVHAAALHSAGQSERALNLLDKTLRLRPGDRQLLGAALGIARDANLPEHMEGYRRQLQP